LWSVESEAFEGFEDQDTPEFEQPSLDEGKSSLMHAHLSYISCIRFTVFIFLACISFDWNLLMIIPSLLQPFPCNRVNKINLDGSYGLVGLTRMVLINLDTFIFYVPFYVVLLYKTTLLC
jgi:hypothetical protein